MTYFSTQLMDGARNCAVNCGGVQEGTNVLILSLTADRSAPVDDLAVQALSAACLEAGAKPQILWGTGMEKGWWDTPNPIILGAFAKADLVINNTGHIGRGLRPVRDLMFRQGITMVRNMASTADVLSSEWATFPFELSDEIIYLIGERLDNARTWRVTSRLGTDITGEFGRPSSSLSGFSDYMAHRRKAKNRPFPEGCHVPVTCRNANGVIVTHRTLPVVARRIGVSEFGFEPVRITIENNRAVNFEGGEEAGKLRRLFEELSEGIGEDAWNLSSFHSGVHPKASSTVAPAANPDLWHRPMHNHSASLHFHVGGSKERQEYDYPFMFQISLHVEPASVYLDGELLLDEGRQTVLDDPRLQTAASKWGDPAELLRPLAMPTR
jgi:hypothetical protein